MQIKDHVIITVIIAEAAGPHLEAAAPTAHALEQTPAHPGYHGHGRG